MRPQRRHTVTVATVVLLAATFVSAVAPAARAAFGGGLIAGAAGQALVLLAEDPSPSPTPDTTPPVTTADADGAWHR